MELVPAYRKLLDMQSLTHDALDRNAAGGISLAHPAANPSTTTNKRPSRTPNAQILSHTASDLIIAPPDPPDEACQRDDEEFRWRADNEDIVMAEQRATAVYVNCWGQAVIRQEGSWADDGDTYVLIALEHLPALISRLQKLAPALDEGRRS